MCQFFGARVINAWNSFPSENVVFLQNELIPTNLDLIIIGSTQDMRSHMVSASYDPYTHITASVSECCGSLVRMIIKDDVFYWPIYI